MYIQLLKAQVGHRRLNPAKNQFTYNVFYLELPITKETQKTPWLFSYNRFNIFSYYDKDHGKGDGSSSYNWIVKECKKKDILVLPNHTVSLIMHPRLFGYAFNPISYWLLRDQNQRLLAVLTEVNNTFGDNHNYLLSHSDNTEILPEDVFTAEKKLYVSPFNKVEGYYEFTYQDSETQFKSVINFFKEKELVLETYMQGEKQKLTSLNILSSVFMYPLMTFMVVFRIHWQAVKLYFKKVPGTLDSKPEIVSGETSEGFSKKDVK